MILNIMERLLINSLLPQQGGIIDLRVAQEARDSVALTSEEITAWSVEDVEGGRVQWNPQAVIDKKIPLSEAAVTMIRKALVELDEKHALQANHISLYEKFVEQKE